MFLYKMLIFKLQNASNCTDLKLYIHKFPGGNTPGPQNWVGVSPLPLDARVHRPTYSELPRPLPQLQGRLSPNNHGALPFILLSFPFSAPLTSHRTSANNVWTFYTQFCAI